jgi:hypothetical protein
MEERTNWIEQNCMAVYWTTLILVLTISTTSMALLTGSSDIFEQDIFPLVAVIFGLQSYTVRAFVVAVVEKRPITLRLIAALFFWLFNGLAAYFGYGSVSVVCLVLFSVGVHILTYPLIFPYIQDKGYPPPKLLWH